VSPVTLLTPGDKVTASHVALLAKMNIKPFFYGFKVQSVFEDGFVYGGEILSLSEEDLCNKFVAGAHYVAAVGLELGIPSVATVGHSIAKAFHRMVAITDQVCLSVCVRHVSVSVCDMMFHVFYSIIHTHTHTHTHRSIGRSPRPRSSSLPPRLPRPLLLVLPLLLRLSRSRSRPLPHPRPDLASSKCALVHRERVRVNTCLARHACPNGNAN
jgi:hypothetical protein